MFCGEVFEVKTDPLPHSRKLSIGGCLAGFPGGVEQIGRSANYRAGEGIRTLDVNLGKVALYH